MIYKCKICGGTLNLSEKKTIVTCEYCGTVQSVPLLDSEKKERLFAKALDYRLDCDFNRAYSAYEQIIIDEPDEPEAYWGALLSDYGIEYVKDSYSGRMMPTCHRTKVKSIFNHGYYAKALELANTENRSIYESDAKEIDAIQKKIINLASKEEPYDVFICYKETDKNGKRTRDSLIAENIYNLLTEKGYKVFFSRITLEDKIGREYEPYIFNALNTAKVMIAVGCDYENYESTWVKNEWTRFLDLKKDDSSKILIPCHYGLNPNNLPEEFSILQSLDLSSIGYEQDLLRGLDKIFNRSVNKNVQIKQESKINKKLIIGLIASLAIAAVSIAALKGRVTIFDDIQNANVGDIIEFGSYEQNNISLDGKEEIEWIVLKKENSEAILISRYVLDCQSYADNNSYVAWTDSNLYNWLSNEFVGNAFSSSEKKYVDDIFILSTSEAKELFSSTTERTAVATDYAIANGLPVSSTYGNCEWWLIPANELSHYAAKVNSNGSINSKADSINIGSGVRPAIVIKY